MPSFEELARAASSNRIGIWNWKLAEIIDLIISMKSYMLHYYYVVVILIYTNNDDIIRLIWMNETDFISCRGKKSIERPIVCERVNTLECFRFSQSHSHGVGDKYYILYTREYDPVNKRISQRIKNQIYQLICRIYILCVYSYLVWIQCQRQQIVPNGMCDMCDCDKIIWFEQNAVFYRNNCNNNNVTFVRTCHSVTVPYLLT